MDLSVKKRQEQSLESLMYGELAARYMLLNAVHPAAELRDKQLSQLLPLLLLRPFAAAAAAVAATGDSGSSERGQERCSSDGSETELRLADTTELLDERKRISRPLTGRYVRHGTGASPATLISLRNMIHERQRQRSSHAAPKKTVQRRTRRRK